MEYDPRIFLFYEEAKRKAGGGGWSRLRAVSCELRAASCAVCGGWYAVGVLLESGWCVQLLHTTAGAGRAEVGKGTGAVRTRYRLGSVKRGAVAGKVVVWEVPGRILCRCSGSRWPEGAKRGRLRGKARARQLDFAGRRREGIYERERQSPPRR